MNKKETNKIKKTKKRKYFKELVYDYVNIMYGKKKSSFFDQVLDSNIQHFDSIFADLRKIHKEKQKYDQHRVFKHANKEFHFILDKILQTQFLPKTNLLKKKLESKYKSTEELQSDIKTLKKITKHKEKIFKRKAQYFGILSNFVTGIDIVISVFLILVISEIAHYLNAVIDSWILGIIFVGFIALFKVTLDRFRIIPKIHQLGRWFYIRTIQHYKEILARYEAVSLVITDAINQNIEAEKIIKMLEHGIHIIKKETIRHKFLGLF